jgi:histone deacetylase HOS3
MDKEDLMKRAFVAIRPPGHHCGDDSPSGFCFVNNVVVAAAHAHLKYGVTRAVIFDIDLHHGGPGLLNLGPFTYS